MPLSEIDFGKSILPLNEEDGALFVDTNVLVAYFHEGHKKHIPCFLFLTYLIKNEIMLCTSEIVVVELINSLARVLYIDDQLTQYKEEYPEASQSEINRKQRSFKGDWSNKVIKSDPETLKKYNGEAISKIEDFISELILFECTNSIIDDIFSLMKDTPVASADAMILSTAINHGLPYVISIDKDMQVCDSMDILCTDTTNDDCDYKAIISDFDIEDYLIEQLGHIEYNRKFP